MSCADRAAVVRGQSRLSIIDASAIVGPRMSSLGMSKWQPIAVRRDPRHLRRRGPRRRRTGDRARLRRGRRPSHRLVVPSRLLRVRSRVRVPQWPRRGVVAAAPVDAPDAGTCRIGARSPTCTRLSTRACRRVDGICSGTRRRWCGTSIATRRRCSSRAPRSGSSPHDGSSARDRRHRLVDHDPGSWSTRARPSRCPDRRGSRSGARGAREPSGRQRRERRRARDGGGLAVRGSGSVLVATIGRSGTTSC